MRGGSWRIPRAIQTPTMIPGVEWTTGAGLFTVAGVEIANGNANLHFHVGFDPGLHPGQLQVDREPGFLNTALHLPDRHSLSEVHD